MKPQEPYALVWPCIAAALCTAWAYWLGRLAWEAISTGHTTWRTADVGVDSNPALFWVAVSSMLGLAAYSVWTVGHYLRRAVRMFFAWRRGVPYIAEQE
jgi:hypothetical protein